MRRSLVFTNSQFSGSLGGGDRWSFILNCSITTLNSAVISQFLTPQLRDPIKAPITGFKRPLLSKLFLTHFLTSEGDKFMFIAVNCKCTYLLFLAQFCNNGLQQWIATMDCNYGIVFCLPSCALQFEELLRFTATSILRIEGDTFVSENDAFNPMMPLATASS